MRKSRLSSYKQDRLIEHFVAGTTARTAARLIGVHRNTAAYFFHRLRQVITAELAAEAADVLDGELEVDESYFGGRRKGTRGRGAAGKTPVFGILKRGGRVYTQIIPNAQRATLLPIIRAKIVPDSLVYSDCMSAYDTLDVAGFRHMRINHSELFGEGANHINGIENFWSQAKRHLRRFNGVPKAHFELYLKECEWRFNTPDPKRQISQLKQWAKKGLTHVI